MDIATLGCAVWSKLTSDKTVVDDARRLRRGRARPHALPRAEAAVRGLPMGVAVAATGARPSWPT